MGNKFSWAKANILRTETKDNQVKANILVRDNIETNQVKANLYIPIIYRGRPYRSKEQMFYQPKDIIYTRLKTRR